MDEAPGFATLRWRVLLSHQHAFLLNTGRQRADSALPAQSPPHHFYGHDAGDAQRLRRLRLYIAAGGYFIGAA